jgi:hypothetical protein
MSDFLSNRRREFDASCDAPASTAMRAAGLVVGLSLAAVAVWLAVRRPRGGDAIGWRGSAGEAGFDRDLPANPAATSAVTSEVHASCAGASAEEQWAEVEEDAEEFGETLPADVVQVTTRRRLPDGKEAIEQFVRCTFAEGDPLGVLHVAFCPPLSVKPTLEVDQLDGPEATIKTTLAEPFGVRLEVRLAEPAEQGTEVVLRIHAAG